MVPTTLPEPAELSSEPTLDFMLGDVDGNGKITAADARTALRIAAQLIAGDDRQLLAADVDGNGKVTAGDARKILRVGAKLATF